MRKSIAAVATLGLLVSSQVTMAKAVTITYWGMWSGSLGKAEQENIERFNKLYAGKIFVKALPMEDYEQKTLTAIAGGASPDCFKLDRFRVGSWAAKDLLLCLDANIKKERINTSIWYKPTYGETVYAGRCYALPWNTDSRGLLFNKNMFSQVGLDPKNPPKTWEELSLASRKLDVFDSNGRVSRAGLNPVGGNWYFNGWLYSAGGNITTPNGKKSTWSSPAGLKALHYIDDMIKKYGGTAKMSAAGDIWGGKMGMQLDGSWNVGNYNALKSKKFQLGVAPPPRPMGLEKEWKSWAGGFAICLPRGSRHQKEAWEFMKWYCANKDPQLAFGRATGCIPVLNSAARDSAFLEADPLFETFTDILPDAEFRTVLPCGAECWNLYAETADSVGVMIQAQKKSPEDILNATQLQAQKVLDRAWARARVK